MWFIIVCTTVSAILLNHYCRADFTQSTLGTVKQQYERPKARCVNDALEHCISDLSKAQEELRKLYSEDKVKIHLQEEGFWVCTVELPDGFFAMSFTSATGPIRDFEKRLFTDKVHKDDKNEIRERGYAVIYDSKGQVKSWERRDGKSYLFFHPKGGIKTFKVHSDRMEVEASWDNQGKLLGERITQVDEKEAKDK